MVLRMLLMISFSGRTKEFLHNFIILTEISAGPWALFSFKPVRMLAICSEVISNMSNLSRINRLGSGNLLLF